MAEGRDSSFFLNMLRNRLREEYPELPEVTQCKRQTGKLTKETKILLKSSPKWALTHEHFSKTNKDSYTEFESHYVNDTLVRNYPLIQIHILLCCVFEVNTEFAPCTHTPFNRLRKEITQFKLESTPSPCRPLLHLHWQSWRPLPLAPGTLSPPIPAPIIAGQERVVSFISSKVCHQYIEIVLIFIFIFLYL